MALLQDGLPARSLLLLATALLLFGLGGGVAGYMAGQQRGEQQTAAILDSVGAQWDAHGGDAGQRFDQAIGKTAAQLEEAASDLKAQVSMYHGCGAICAAIAYQFSAELLRARDAIKDVEVPPLPSWQDTMRESRAPVGSANGAHLPTGVIVAIGLLCVTVALCFGLACLTLLRLRRAEPV